MNLRSFLGSLFTKANLNGELDQIRESARADAQLVVSTYVQEFEREASMILLEHSQQFGEVETGNEHPDPLDYAEQVEYSNLDDASNWRQPDPLDYDERLPITERPELRPTIDLDTATRPELMRLARDLGLKYTRKVTKVKLIEMLENS